MKSQAFRIGVLSGIVEDSVVFSSRPNKVWFERGGHGGEEIIPTVSPTGFLSAHPSYREDIVFNFYDGMTIRSLQVFFKPGDDIRLRFIGAGKESFILIAMPPARHKCSIRPFYVFRLPTSALFDLIANTLHISIDDLVMALDMLSFDRLSFETSKDMWTSVNTFWNPSVLGLSPVSYSGTKTGWLLNDILLLDFDRGQLIDLNTNVKPLDYQTFYIPSSLVAKLYSMITCSRFTNYFDLSEWK